MVLVVGLAAATGGRISAANVSNRTDIVGIFVRLLQKDMALKRLTELCETHVAH